MRRNHALPLRECCLLKKKQASYYEKPITWSNLESYIAAEYPNVPAGQKRLIDKYELQVEGFRQNDYGPDNDCTIISIAIIVYTKLKNLNKGISPYSFQKIYDTALKYAKRCGYTPETGTWPFFNNYILRKTLSTFGIKKKVKSAYFKRIGFHAKHFKKYLPLNLSISSDGRGYYEDHSVTIIGYVIYNIAGKEKVFLTVLDNWSTEYRYIDFDRLGTISSINYILN